MAAMGRTGTKRLVIKKEGFELVLEKDEQIINRLAEHPFEFSDEPFKHHAAWSRADHTLPRGNEMLARSMPAPYGNEKPKEDVSSVYVKSPMVGTFYSSPSPEDPPFIKVGDKIGKDTVVGIIEAMKVMNEIKANVEGTVAEVLVEAGQPIEFGSKLFRIS